MLSLSLEPVGPSPEDDEDGDELGSRIPVLKFYMFGRGHANRPFWSISEGEGSGEEADEDGGEVDHDSTRCNSTSKGSAHSMSGARVPVEAEGDPREGTPKAFSCGSSDEDGGAPSFFGDECGGFVQSGIYYFPLYPGHVSLGELFATS